MTKFSNGERLRQRLPGGARGGPEGAAGAAAPRRRWAGARRTLQGQSEGGAAPRHRDGSARRQLRRTRTRDPLLDGKTGLDLPALPYPLSPLASREAAESGPQAGAGLTPRCRAERSEPPPRGCSYPAPASAGLRPPGAARPSRHRGAYGERRGEPRPGGRGRRGTYSGSRCGLGWVALILREGRSWPPPRGPGCSAAVRK